MCRVWEFLCGESEGMKPFGTTKCWMDIINVYLKEIFWENGGLIHLAQDTKNIIFSKTQ